MSEYGKVAFEQTKYWLTVESRGTALASSAEFKQQAFDLLAAFARYTSGT